MSHAARAPANPPASRGNGASAAPYGAALHSVAGRTLLLVWEAARRFARPSGVSSFAAVSCPVGLGGQGGYIGLRVHTSSVCEVCFRRESRSTL